MLEERVVKDAFGVEIAVGDIVARAANGDLTMHRILKMNKRSLVLTGGANFMANSWSPGGGYFIRRFATSLEEVDLADFNNRELRFSKVYRDKAQVVKLNIIRNVTKGD